MAKHAIYGVDGDVDRDVNGDLESRYLKQQDKNQATQYGTFTTKIE